MNNHGRVWILVVAMVLLLVGCGSGAAATEVITAVPLTDERTEIVAEEPEVTEKAVTQDVTEEAPTDEPTEAPTEEPTEEPAEEPSADLPALPVAVFTVNEGEDAGDSVWAWRPGDMPRMLAGGGSIVDKLFVTSDGEVVIFERRRFERPQVSSVWAVNTDGTNERELLSVDDLLAMMVFEDGFGSNLGHAAFLPDSHVLLFSTQTRIDAPGIYQNQDLRLLDADTGELTVLQEAGPGRQQDFSISPDGSQVAVITDEGISVVAIDGSGRTGNLLDYDAAPVSDFSQLAEVGWTADSTSLIAILPPEDIFAEPPLPHYVIDIPVDGSPPTEVAQFIGDGLFGSMFNVDGSAFAYLEGVGEGDDRGVALHIVTEDGTNNRVALTAPDLRPRIWDSDGIHFFTFDLEQSLLYMAGIGEEGMVVGGAVYNAEDWLRNSVGLIAEDTVLYIAYTEDRSTYALWQVSSGGTPSVVMVLNDDSGIFIPKLVVAR